MTQWGPWQDGVEYWASAGDAKRLRWGGTDTTDDLVSPVGVGQFSDARATSEFERGLNCEGVPGLLGSRPSFDTSMFPWSDGSGIPGQVSYEVGVSQEAVATQPGLGRQSTVWLGAAPLTPPPGAETWEAETPLATFLNQARLVLGYKVGGRRNTRAQYEIRVSSTLTPDDFNEGGASYSKAGTTVWSIDSPVPSLEDIDPTRYLTDGMLSEGDTTPLLVDISSFLNPDGSVVLVTAAELTEPLHDVQQDYEAAWVYSEYWPFGVSYKYRSPRIRFGFPDVVTPPTASFAYSIQSNGAIVDFDASASTGDIVEYRWDYSDPLFDGPEILSSPYAAHLYAVAGTVLVTLTVVDSAGQTATATRELTIDPEVITGVAGPTTTRFRPV